MANKFKCKDCRFSFSLNTGSEEICPKCKSDNIEPVNSPKLVWKLLLFVVMAAVGYFVTNIFVGGLQPQVITVGTTDVAEIEIPLPPVADGGGETAVVDEPVEEIEPLLPFEANFGVFEKNLSENGFAFKVVVNADYDSDIRQYELYTMDDDTVLVLTSVDGKFNSDKYYATDGRYFIKVIYKDGNYAYSAGIEGIVKPEKEEPKTIAKMDIAELQSKIDKSLKNRTYIKWFASVVKGGDKRLDDKVTVINTTNGVTYTSIADMYCDCWYDVDKINVEDVTYNETTGRLNSITISTKYK